LVRKISIIGGPGAGKTTLSLRLGQRLGIAVCHLDDLFWVPPPSLMPLTERRARLGEIQRRSSYIIEGGHHWSFPQRIAGCDTLIWLDLAPLLRARGVMRRGIARALSRREGESGGAEPVRKMPLVPFWRYFLQDWVENFAGQAVAQAEPGRSFRLIRLQSWSAVADFLDRLPK
jgi:hypothetical protein